MLIIRKLMKHLSNMSWIGVAAIFIAHTALTYVGLWAFGEADLLAAQTMAESNQILADGVTPEVLRYMELQVLREMANNQNAVFFPVEMLGNTAMENRMLMGPNQ